jgi:WD40 repeat protein
MLGSRTVVSLLALVACLLAAGPALAQGGGAARRRPEPSDHQGDALPARALARLGTVRLRHGGLILAVAFGPNGKLLASGGNDGMVRLWDTATGRSLARLPVPGAGVRAVAFAPDGKAVAAADNDGTVLLWDTATGKERHRLKVPGGPAFALGFAADRCLYVSSDRDLVHVTDAATGREVLALKVRHVRALALSPDGRQLAAADGGGIRVWEVPSGKELCRLPGHAGGTGALAFAPDGRALASSGWEDETARVWDLASGKERWRCARAGRAVALAFGADGGSLVTRGVPHEVCLWHEGGKSRAVLARDVPGRGGLAVAPGGGTLAFGCDTAVRLIDLKSGKEVTPGAPPVERVAGLAAAPAGPVAVVSSTGAWTVWPFAPGRDASPTWRAGRARAVAASLDGKFLAVGGEDGGLELWDGAGTRRLRALRGHRGRVTGLAFAPDGRVLASGGEEQHLILWDVAGGKELRRCGPPGDQVWSIAFSPDGRLLVSKEYPGRLRLWEVATGRQVGLLDRTPRLRIAPPGGAVFLPGGRRMAVWGDKDEVGFWDGRSPDLEGPLDGPTGWVVALALSPDGRLVAAVHVKDRPEETRVVRLYEGDSGQEVGRFAGHQGLVTCLAFGAGGRVLFSGSDDGTVLAWDVTGRSEGGRLRPAVLAPQDLDRLWEELGRAAAARAHRAVWELVAGGEQAVPCLGRRLAGASTAAARIARLVVQLDDPRFARRREAAAELEEAGKEAVPALVLAAAKSPSAEVRRRAEALLQVIERQKPSPEHLRHLRALTVLEQAGTDEARKVLEGLAKLPEGSWHRAQAEAALKRLSALSHKPRP